MHDFARRFWEQLRPPLLTPEGNARIAVLEDRPQGVLSDIYHLLLVMPWPFFLAFALLSYLTLNTVFAVLYLLGGDAIANAEPGNFWDAFFFSVQTVATIGYGVMHPQTYYGHAMVMFESVIGLGGVATATGLTFARISRPTARIGFSNVAVVAPFNGKPTLMFRAVNQRRNRILEAQMTVSILRREYTLEGQVLYRFSDLPLVRQRTPIFALTWTAMHIIDEQSPLYGFDEDSLAAADLEIIISLTGLDDTLGQTIHARHAYTPSAVYWQYRFVDIFSETPTGSRVINLRYFHAIEPIPHTTPSRPLE